MGENRQSIPLKCDRFLPCFGGIIMLGGDADDGVCRCVVGREFAYRLFAVEVSSIVVSLAAKMGSKLMWCNGYGGGVFGTFASRLRIVGRFWIPIVVCCFWCACYLWLVWLDLYPPLNRRVICNYPCIWWWNDCFVALCFFILCCSKKFSRIFGDFPVFTGFNYPLLLWRSLYKRTVVFF